MSLQLIIDDDTNHPTPRSFRIKEVENGKFTSRLQWDLLCYILLFLEN